MPSRPTAADCAIWTRPHRAERRIRPGKGPGPAAGETDLVTATTLPMTVSPTALAHSRRTAPEYETDLSAKHALVRQHMSQRHVAAGDQRPGSTASQRRCSRADQGQAKGTGKRLNSTEIRQWAKTQDADAKDRRWRYPLSRRPGSIPPPESRPGTSPTRQGLTVPYSHAEMSASGC